MIVNKWGIDLNVKAGQLRKYHPLGPICIYVYIAHVRLIMYKRNTKIHLPVWYIENGFGMYIVEGNMSKREIQRDIRIYRG